MPPGNHCGTPYPPSLEGAHLSNSAHLKQVQGWAVEEALKRPSIPSLPEAAMSAKAPCAKESTPGRPAMLAL